MKSEDEIRAQLEYLGRCLARKNDCCKYYYGEHTKECDLRQQAILAAVKTLSWMLGDEVSGSLLFDEISRV